MIKAIRYSIFTSSIFLFAIFYLTGNWNGMLLGMMLLWLNNCIYSFEKLSRRIYFLFFHLMIFLFLLSRPTIGYLRGEKWWTYNPSDAVSFTLAALSIAMLGLFLGSLVFEFISRKKSASARRKNLPALGKKTTLRDSGSPYIQTIQILSLVAFLVCLVCSFYMEMDRLAFMQGRTYVELYVDYTPQIPFYIRYPASMTEYLLCIYLATLPPKRNTFVLFVLYLGSLVPSFLIGIRNPIMLAAVFVFLYYYMRDARQREDGSVLKNGEKKWLGKAEKALMVIAVPVVLFFLYIYASMRENIEVGDVSIANGILNLFYQQGTSFNVVGSGYTIIPDLPKTEFHNYTFGPIIDYFRFNWMGKLLFGTVPIPPGNNLRAALEGNRLSHALSYQVLDNRYLEGRGLDSSFVLEPYVDWGWIGLIVFCLCLGFFLIYLTNMMKKGWLSRTIALYILTNIFFSPRSAALDWLSFLCTIPFWMSVLLCAFAAKLFAGKYTVLKKQKKEREYAV